MMTAAALIDDAHEFDPNLSVEENILESVRPILDMAEASPSDNPFVASGTSDAPHADPLADRMAPSSNPFAVDTDAPTPEASSPWAETTPQSSNPFAVSDDGSVGSPVDPFAAQDEAPGDTNPFTVDDAADTVVAIDIGSTDAVTPSAEGGDPFAIRTQPVDASAEVVAEAAIPAANQGAPEIEAAAAALELEPTEEAPTPAATSRPLGVGTPRNPFAMPTIPPEAPAEEEEEVVTPNLFSARPKRPQDTSTVIPMQGGIASRERTAASADAPPSPPPTLLPTWPTRELPEEARLRGSFLSPDGRWRIFTKEGVYTEFPPATPTPDWDAHVALGHRVALYRRTGDHATIEYFDSVPESFEVLREPYALTINGEAWKRADYDLSGRTMKGSWMRADGMELTLDHDAAITLGGRPGTYRLSAGRIDIDWDDESTSAWSFLSTLSPSSKHPYLLWLAGVQCKLQT